MATDERHLSSNSDDVTASASAKNQLASVTREDAVDISLQDHVNEVTEDAVTNPVEQAKKRARTSPGQGGFLATDTKPPPMTAKTIQDEAIALYREEKATSSLTSKLIDETSTPAAVSADDCERIEQASDDSDEDDGEDQPIRHKKGRRTIDSDYIETVEHAEESDEAPLDELEPDNIEDHFADEERKEKKKPEKSMSRRHRTDVDEANLMGDEQEETVFIDNLPNDEQGIKSMLMEVRRNIMTLEK